MPRATFEHIRKLAESVAHLPGDFAELGIWRGDTFAPLAELAGRTKRLCHAIDSFAGMSEPTVNDYAADGSCRFKKGSLDAGGPEALLAALGPDREHVRIWQGVVPDVLSRVLTPQGLAFSHLDLDQFAPTLHAIRWAWPLTVPGGIMVCHDWDPKGPTILATAAVRTFIAHNGPQPTGENLTSGHVWFRQPAEEDE